MAVVKLSVNKRVAEALAMSDGGASFGTYSGSTWKTTDVDEAVLASDGGVVVGICLTSRHGRRQLYTTTGVVTTGSQLPSHIGDVAVYCTITGGDRAGTVASQLATKEEIEIDNYNPQGLGTILSKHHIDENGIIYTNKEGIEKVTGGGVTAVFTASYCTYTLTTACQAPDEAYNCVFYGAMTIIAKDGQHMDAASSYRQMYQAEMIGLGIDPQVAARQAASMGQS